MFKYYISLISETFQSLSRWRGMVVLLATLVVAVAILFNAEIGQKILVKWNAINPIWALVPIVLGGVWVFLSLNYQRYVTAQNTIEDLRRELKIIKEPGPGKTLDLLFVFKWAKSVKTSMKDENIRAAVAQLDITNRSQEEFYATPRLRFSDASSKVFRIEGLWSDRPIPEFKSTIGEPMRFLAGERHKLDVALKFERETFWYGIDNASPFAKYRSEKYKLIVPVHITVTLEGNMTPITKYFQLKEENGVPKIDEIRLSN